MEQKTALWYFIMVFAILIALHTLLPDSRSEIITYSQFKVLVKQNLVTDLVVEEATVGSITPQPEGGETIASEFWHLPTQPTRAAQWFRFYLPAASQPA